MEKDALRNILQNSYKRESWIKTLQFLSGQNNALTIFVEPKEITLSSQKQKNIVRKLIQLGTLKTTDNITLPIFEVELQDNIKIEYNRVGVNELIKEFILKDAQKGAIATYHYKDSGPKEWRFSFISKNGASDYFQEAETVETTPKKYTYIFGTPEPHRTAIERLFNLKQSSLNLEDFFEAFNVEPVSKNFFKEYKNFYLDFVHHLSTTDNRIIFEIEYEADKVDLEIRNFVKRLLGRIVFLYFLQKKNWLGATNKNYEDGDPNFLENLFNGTYGTIDQKQFYGKWLSKLFFKALNTPNRPNDAFELPNKSKRWIPFLNGGLFEENQEPQKHKELNFPVYLFEELFHFFNGYNFTIYENSPEEHIVAVDPEMLGNIFENLLEDNADKGAFYTPKEIVHYMTQESLVEYLHTKTNKPKAALENLVKHQNGESFSRDDLLQIENYIDKVKICDPAIGSGAFPMGLLQEIFTLKQFIHFQMGYEVWSPAKIKQDIIQNSIYGVDIEAGAVDIARLRFWLSLVVDEPIPKPLPNLDYKIMQGNSLIEKFAGIDLSTLMEEDGEKIVEQTYLDLGDDYNAKITVFDEADKAHFQQLLKKYFAPEEWEKLYDEKVDKYAVKKEINNFVEGRIHAIIDKDKRKLKNFVEKFEKKHNIKSENQLKQLVANKKINPKSKDFKNYLSKKDRLKEIDKIEQQLIDFQYTDERPYFMWHVFFNDVFEQGGFDIVIGNPPYIQLQKALPGNSKHKFADLYKKLNFKTFERTGDIYALFYEKGLNILKEKGSLIYITSNKWMRANYGKTLRQFFTKKDPLLLIDLGPNVFETATVDTNILLIKNQENQNQLQAITVNHATDLKNLNSQDFIPLKPQAQESWIILSKQEQAIKTQIEKMGAPLKDWDVKIYRGVLTGYNEAFIIDGKTKNQLIAQDLKSAQILKPILRGKDIKRYQANFADLWLINTHNGVKSKGIKPININNYPAIKEHLDQYWDKLVKRQDKGVTPYNLRNCAYLEEFEKQKIVYSEISQEPSFILDKQKTYIGNTAYILTGKSLKYLLALLNSKFVAYSFSKFYSISLGDKGYRYLAQYMSNLPIPKIDKKDQKPFEQLVDLVILLKDKKTIPINVSIKNEQIALFFEEVIDACVYELYFKEEMHSKQINVLDLVRKEISNVFGNFENIDLAQESDKIWQLYNNLKDGEVQRRMRMFVTKSPEVLKPIIQHS